MKTIKRNGWNAKVLNLTHEVPPEARVIIEPGDWTRYDFWLSKKPSMFVVFGLLIKSCEEDGKGRVEILITECEEFFKRHEGFIDEQQLLDDPLYGKFNKETNPWTRQAVLKAIYLAFYDKE